MPPFLTSRSTGRGGLSGRGWRRQGSHNGGGVQIRIATIMVRLGDSVFLDRDWIWRDSHRSISRPAINSCAARQSRLFPALQPQRQLIRITNQRRVLKPLDYRHRERLKRLLA